jgi:hypothetical protein
VRGHEHRRGSPFPANFSKVMNIGAPWSNVI